MAVDTRVRISYSIQDELNVSAVATAYAYVDSGQTIADLNTPVLALGAQLDAITAGKIVAVSVGLAPALPDGIKSAAAAGSRCGDTGVLDFTAGPALRVWGYAIPALAEAMLSNQK